MWLVTWTVISYMLIACPSPPPVCDEFGRCGVSMSTTLVACYESSEKQMERKFESEAEALAFVERGESSAGVGYGYTDTMKDFKVTYYWCDSGGSGTVTTRGAGLNENE